MNRGTFDALRLAVAQHGIAVLATVTAAEGSTPREAGAAMVVTPESSIDTIGGGALEYETIAAARRLMLDQRDSWAREVLSFPLGPSLGQCCGGRVKLLLEVFTADESAALPADPSAPGCPALLLRPTAAGAPMAVAMHRKAAGGWPAAVGRLVGEMLSGQRLASPTLLRGRHGAADWYLEPVEQPGLPLLLYGAGHVGRALVRLLEPLAFRVSWVDVAAERFPPAPPAAVRIVATREPTAVAASAPAGACHLVMTYSHPLDLAICHAVLHRGEFAYLGLIGSASKRARFAARLAALGIAPTMLARLHCPIGLDGVRGKEPNVIAVSVVADLLRRAAGVEAIAANMRPLSAAEQAAAPHPGADARGEGDAGGRR